MSSKLSWDAVLNLNLENRDETIKFLNEHGVLIYYTYSDGYGVDEPIPILAILYVPRPLNEYNNHLHGTIIDVQSKEILHIGIYNHESANIYNFKTTNDIQKYRVEPITDASTITLYRYNNNWKIATAKCADISNMTLGTDLTYMSALNDVFEKYDMNGFEDLDINYNYTLSFRHPILHLFSAELWNVKPYQLIHIRSVYTGEFRKSGSIKDMMPLYTSPLRDDGTPLFTDQHTSYYVDNIKILEKNCRDALNLHLKVSAYTSFDNKGIKPYGKYANYAPVFGFILRRYDEDKGCVTDPITHYEEEPFMNVYIFESSLKAKIRNMVDRNNINQNIIKYSYEKAKYTALNACFDDEYQRTFELLFPNLVPYVKMSATYLKGMQEHLTNYIYSITTKKQFIKLSKTENMILESICKDVVLANYTNKSDIKSIVISYVYDRSKINIYYLEVFH